MRPPSAAPATESGDTNVRRPRLARLLIPLSLALAGFVVARHVRKVRRVPERFRAPFLFFPLPPLTTTLISTVLRLTQPLRSKPDLPSGIRSSVRYVSSGQGGAPVKVVLYEPTDRPSGSAALLWVHGGGMMAGDAEGGAPLFARLAQALNALVASVEYRLAPRHPFPAALDDCYAALKSLHDEAAQLGIDRARIAIGGTSAGGGLCAALAQRALDAGEVKPVFQALVYPMLDDRTALKCDHGGRGELMWRPSENLVGWTAYLGHIPRREENRPYAVPARRDNLTGVAPAWIGVGGLDLFCEEDVAYAARLRAAGVPCELVVVEGAYHGFDDVAEDAPESVAFVEGMIDALRSALASKPSDSDSG